MIRMIGWSFLIVSLFSVTAAYIRNYVNKEVNALEFISRISLETNCDVDPEIFEVLNMRTGASSPFNHGEAFLRARTGDKFKIVTSDKYPQISIDGEVFDADGRVEIFQDCNVPKLENIFESLNNQFSPKTK